jgi:predicted enzyme related to lactoylglutathione lyase
MARVTGIGGIFLKSKDPRRLAQWYATHLGIQLNDWGGAQFLWSDEVPPTTGSTAWSTFPEDTPYFGPNPTQSTMLNYRVDDLDALLTQLAAASIWIDPHREDADYGRFAWIKDCDNNRLELWQPIASR